MAKEIQIKFEDSFASHEKSIFWSNKNSKNSREVMKSSGTKYIFECDKCNHEFLRPIYKINTKEHCTYCVIPSKLLCDNNDCKFCFEKSFASHEKSIFWSTKNSKNPREVMKSSGTKYIFVCDKCKHEIELSLANINCGNWCSYCANKKLCSNDCKLCFDKSFASHEKSKFVVDKNINLRNLFKNSHEKILFNCNNCNHNFVCSLGNINFNKWCPYCCIPSRLLCDNNECKLCFEKSFASHEKAQYWSIKNKNIPRQVFNSSNNKYIFNCNNCNHEFDIALNAINAGNWCSYCCNPPQKLCNVEDCMHCFEHSFASHPKSKYYSDKNKLTSREVMKHNGKYIFFCDICNHEFERILYNITEDITHCIYCTIPTKILCSDNDCNFCFERSFASFEKSKYWSNKNILNPRELIKYTADKFIFNCNICNHEFESSLSNITQNKWCPYCSSSKLCNDKNCNECFQKSFASHENVKYYSNQNKLKPREVFKNGDTVVTFNCICNHTFSCQIKHINIGGWCPYCCNPPKKLCNDNNCNQCFNKSFASHKKSKYWSNKNELKSREVFLNCNSKFIFNCENGHEFFKALCYKNSWCPYCVNKTEQKLYEQLSPYYNNLKQQYKVEWCKNKTYLPFDFVLEEFKIIIELDGLQHFEQVSNWTSPEETQQNDKYKMKCANSNNFSVIRILQENVYDDTYDWLTELKTNIDKIKNENTIQNIYMCKNDEYNVF